MPETETVLVVPASAHTALVDALLRETNLLAGEPLRIDLSDVRYIEPVALLHFLALASTRADRQLATYWTLPQHRRVRDFFRAWNFPGAIKAITNRPLHTLVPLSDHKYFGERPVHYGVRGNRQDTPLDTHLGQAPLVEHLAGRTRFFGFQVYDFQQTTPDSMLLEQQERWMSPLVRAVLLRYLSGPAGDVTRIHVSELLSNVIQHPNASRAIIVSQVQTSARGRTTFTLGVWDNGEGIATTLLKKLEREEPVRDLAASTEHSDTFLIHPDSTGLPQPSMSSRFTPDSNSSLEEVLLASLLPGISQKVPTTRPSRDEAPSDSLGHGLFWLYRSVVGDFQGQLAFRTGDLFLNLKGSKDVPATYLAKVTRFNQTSPFPGNFITLRLPTAGEPHSHGDGQRTQ